jgi:hypothetical protein
MIRLSKKGWNNVLIFSMLIMIMVFNGVHKKFSIGESPNTQVTLLPESTLVLTLEYPNASIERIGQGWRSNPAVALGTEQLALIMSTWQTELVELQANDEEAKVMTAGKMPTYYVIAHLAGKPDGAVYAFYVQLDDVWIHDQQQNRWLTAPKNLITMLIPASLGVRREL